MRREVFFVVAALTVVSGAPGLGQDDTGNRGGSDLNVSITLEHASQSRAAVTNLELPIEQGSRRSPEQARRFEPADFARPNRLESIQLAADDLPRGTTAAAVRCQAFIGRDGSLGEYFCDAGDNRAHRDVLTAVLPAVPAQRFVAARVDGQSVRVLMNFAVYVVCSSGSCLAVAARNHGYHIEKLGLDYLDPQPILEGDDWYEGFAYKLRWARSQMPSIRTVNPPRWRVEGLRYVMSAEIDANGIAARGCLYWLGVSNSQASPGSVMAAPLLSLRTKRSVERAIASLGDVRYVPGMIDGAPATLRLYEESVVGDYEHPDAFSGFHVGDIDCD